MKWRRRTYALHLHSPQRSEILCCEHSTDKKKPSFLLLFFEPPWKPYQNRTDDRQDVVPFLTAVFIGDINSYHHRVKCEHALPPYTNTRYSLQVLALFRRVKFKTTMIVAPTFLNSAVGEVVDPVPSEKSSRYRRHICRIEGVD